MSKAQEEFLNDIREMVAKQQYNSEAYAKLISTVALAQILAEKEKNEGVKATLNKIAVIGELLAEKLWKLKDK